MAFVCPMCGEKSHRSFKITDQIEVCMNCQWSLDAYKSGAPGAEYHLRRCLDTTNDENCKQYIQVVLDSKSVSPASEKESTDNPTSITASTSTNSWTGILSVIAWIVFIASIIVGFVVATPFFNMDDNGTGFAILLGCVVGALFFLAAIKVFATMADDIHAIRNKLDSKK